MKKKKLLSKACTFHPYLSRSTPLCNQAIKSRKRFGMSVVLIVLSTVLAVVANDVSIIFGFFGATSNPMLMFILPTINHLKMHRPGVKQT
jgi:amino acid permease